MCVKQALYPSLLLRISSPQLMESVDEESIGWSVVKTGENMGLGTNSLFLSPWLSGGSVLICVAQTGLQLAV